MNKDEIAFQMSEKMNIPLTNANNLLTALLNTIQEELINNGSVKIVDFGHFKVVQRAGRKGYNPYYQKSVDIPPCLEPVFVAGKAFKEKIVQEAIVS